MIYTSSDLERDRFGMKTLFHVIMAGVMLFAADLLAFTLIDAFCAVTGLGVTPVIVAVQSLLNIGILLLIFYLYNAYIIHSTPREYRVTRPCSLVTWCLCAVALPLLVCAFFLLFIPGRFGASDAGPGQAAMVITNAIFAPCLVAGITEELIFRGFIMRLLEVRWNRRIAVLVPSVLFALLHLFGLQNPTLTDVLLLLVAGTGAGVMFSMIALQSGSIWPGAIVHGLWNLVIIGGIFGIGAPAPDALFTYTLQSDSVLLTGGAFGIESSVPAVVGYGLVILLAWWMSRQAPAEAPLSSTQL